MLDFRLGAALLLTGAGLFPTAAQAAEAPAQSAATRAIAACRAVQEPGARLACFDKAAAGLEQALASGEVAVVDREQQRQVRRQAFGLNLPSLSLFDRGEPKETLERLSTTLAGASLGPDQRLRFETVDGAVWRMTDPQLINRVPAKGAALSIRSGALGSYFCSVGSVAGRCDRLR